MGVACASVQLTDRASAFVRDLLGKRVSPKRDRVPVAPHGLRQGGEPVHATPLLQDAFTLCTVPMDKWWGNGFSEAVCHKQVRSWQDRQLRMRSAISD